MIEQIFIGDELLRGDTVNTNASCIAKALSKQDYVVQKQTVVSDTLEQIEKVIKEGLKQAKILIITGGLGPTLDDITKNAAAKALDIELVLDTPLYQKLKDRFGDSEAVKNQAYVLKDAILLENKEGSAPGMIHFSQDKAVIFLPGVPSEMRAMIDPMLSFLKKNFPTEKKTFRETFSLCFMAEVVIDPVLRKLKKQHPEVEMGIYPFLGGIHISLSSQISLQELLDIKNEIIEGNEDKIFISPNRKIEEALHLLLIEKKATLALAESCSGGNLASRLTAFAGCSEYLLGSVVSYSNAMKHGILQVKQSTLDTDGAVSKKTVSEMLDGLFALTTCDYAIAISGIAGPSGGTKEKPIGTVYIGIGKRSEPHDIGKVLGRGQRLAIVDYSVNTAFSALYRRIKYNRRSFQDHG